MKRFLQNQFDRLTRRAASQILNKSTDSYNVLEMAKIKAAYDSAAYYAEHMIKVQSFETDLHLLSHAISLSQSEGLFLEFGVATGRTISHIASVHKGSVYGFDSFEGLPEGWRTDFGVGRFAGIKPRVASNALLVKGRFSDTLPPFIHAHSGPISFLHIDCDLYSSTKVVFDALDERISEGCIIVFDEYFNYPGWQQHEFKAFHEFVDRRSLAYRYEGFVPNHQQVCVSILPGGPRA